MENPYLTPDYLEALSAFNAEGVEYLIIGAFAASAHGLLRATGDIDLWIRPTRDNATRVYRALARFGAPLDGVSATDFTSDDLIFQVGRAPHRIDVITAISGVSFEAAWPRRLAATFGPHPVAVIGLDDLLANKRASGRPKDLLDVAQLEKLRSGARPKKGR